MTDAKLPITAKEKQPRQLGEDLALAVADLLVNNTKFREQFHQKSLLFFRATVTDSRTSGGILQVQIKRTGQTTADASWYPVMDAGYTDPTPGDDILMAHTDSKKMSVCVIGARTVARSLGTREPVVDRLGRVLTDNSEGIVYAYTL